MASNVDSVLDIYNLALAAAGAPGRISQVNENSREREVCERWYDLARTTVQEAAYWPASKAIQSLALLGTRDYNVAWTVGDPPPEYKYKYALPSDYLRARYISDFSPFDVTWSVDRRVLVTNANPCVLVYTRDSQTVSHWTPGEQNAIAHGLASFIGPELTGKRFNIDRAEKRANEIIMQARVEAANSVMQNFETVPAWISERGYVGSASPTRFFYPTGSLFGAGGQVSA